MSSTLVVAVAARWRPAKTICIMPNKTWCENCAYNITFAAANFLRHTKVRWIQADTPCLRMLSAYVYVCRMRIAEGETGCPTWDLFAHWNQREGTMTREDKLHVFTAHASMIYACPGSGKAVQKKQQLRRRRKPKKERSHVIEMARHRTTCQRHIAHTLRMRACGERSKACLSSDRWVLYDESRVGCMCARLCLRPVRCTMYAHGKCEMLLERESEQPYMPSQWHTHKPSTCSPSAWRARGFARAHGIGFSSAFMHINFINFKPFLARRPPSAHSQRC